jgi:flavodoxin I
MKKVGIFYGSTMGYTKTGSEIIAEKIGEDISDVFSISDVSLSEVMDYDVLILGASTWGYGELQDDWATVIEKFSSADLSSKKVAIFGYGDGESYPDTFVDAIGELYDAVQNTGAEIIGHTEDTGYVYESSKAFRDGNFVGLPLDDANQSEKTDTRISNWVEKLKKDI